MTYKVEGAVSNGQMFKFADAEAYEAALDWYAARTKREIVEWCAAREIDLIGPSLGTNHFLAANWEHIAMEAWAMERLKEDAKE